MKSLLICAVLIAAIGMVGCSSSTTPESRPQASSASIQSAEECIAGWANIGMWLPDRREIGFFGANFDSTKKSLFAALSHPDERVRMRAAYVIDEIGGRARAAGPQLLSQLENEKSRLVRMYILAALASIDCDSDKVRDVLKDRFDALESANVPRRPDDSYSEVDEKIEVAATLYEITVDDTKEVYLDFVTEWLKPPPEDLSGPLLDGYWERRRIAVMALERMPSAVEAVPLLESLRDEPDAKPWVKVHVPRVLAALRNDSSK